MYAIVQSGGKQYRVERGGLLTVDRLEGEAGATVALGDVLLVADGDQVKAGVPFVSGAKVNAQIVAHGRGDKVVVFRYKNKTRSRRTTGQRRGLTTVKITGIEV
ncbi:MAG: 50S ribosomal protein L21 [Chloroflexi bacterium]|nr:50S ribosomal protein L21 [Chloroflexota bacterium]